MTLDRPEHSLTVLPKLSTIAVLLHVAGTEPDDCFALAICKATGYPSGTVVPVLKRLSGLGYMTRSQTPTTTGRDRVVHHMTTQGTAFATALVNELEPRIRALAKSPAADGAVVGKANTSTIWILSEAMTDGTVHGYSDAMRPVTHQAVYAEMGRLRRLRWLESVDDVTRVTASGLGVAGSLAEYWAPVIKKAQSALRR